MIVYKARADLKGIHLGTDKGSSGWGSPKYWYEKNFDGGPFTMSFGEALLKEILFDHPLHSWDEKTW